jgi:DNA-binding PadR family transcriptional regulator
MMSRARRPSAQTRIVLEVFLDDPDRWRHGYSLAQDTGIASGTLYPLLIRLADREFLESRWEQEVGDGRPPRHLYRLSSTGREYAARAVRGPAGHAVGRALGEGA